MHVFGFVVTRIDFGEMILVKSEPNVTQFLVGYAYGEIVVLVILVWMG